MDLPGPFALSAAAATSAPPKKSGKSDIRDPVWQYDLPEIPELDNLFAPEGPIKDAETLASEVFGGSKRTWFLVNGRYARNVLWYSGSLVLHYVEADRKSAASLIVKLPPLLIETAPVVF